VTTVLKDLELLGISKSFEEIKEMKKSSYNALLSKTINNIAFEDLEKLKLSHSKVENVKHKTLQMRKYFMPSDNNATKEEIQTIFKLRCRVTELKTNLKGIYDSYECSLCGGEEETQAHILECPEIEKINEDKSEVPKYEKLFDNEVKELVNIARKFKQNMTIKENILKSIEDKY
jgi:hypothetical protein